MRTRQWVKKFRTRVTEKRGFVCREIIAFNGSTRLAEIRSRYPPTPKDLVVMENFLHPLKRK